MDWVHLALVAAQCWVYVNAVLNFRDPKMMGKFLNVRETSTLSRRNLQLRLELLVL